MRRGSVIAITYALFAVLASLINLMGQWVVFRLYAGPLPLFAAMTAGTGTSLVVKYLLDKNWIFYDTDYGAIAHARKFSLYAFMGLFTTAIFWTIEIIFHALDTQGDFTLMGAAFGLAVSYFIKYKLDRRFVFEARR